MSKLDPRIEAIRKEYDLAADDFWKIKQNGQWVCKHAALEVISVKAEIKWFPPQILEMDAVKLVTSMIVTGKMGDRLEWSTGETNPTNYSVTGRQPAYPWAMSEKRAKDRVILKLVGIHGLVYSDAEGDFAAEQAPIASASGFDRHILALNSTGTLAALQTAFEAARADKSLTAEEAANIIARKDQIKAAFALGINLGSGDKS